MLGDEVGQGPGQPIAAGQLQPLIHMGLEDQGAGGGVIEGVVGVAAFPLVFDEPLGAMQLAHVVVEGPGAHQVDVGLDCPGPLLSQAGDHQGVLEGAGRFH